MALVKTMGKYLCCYSKHKIAELYLWDDYKYIKIKH